MGVSGLVPCLLTSSWNLEYFVKDYHIDAHIVQAIILLGFNAKNNEVYLDFLMFEIVGYYIIKPFTCGNLPKPMFLFSLGLTHLVIITCIVLFVSPHPLIPTGWRWWGHSRRNIDANCTPFSFFIFIFFCSLSCWKSFYLDVTFFIYISFLFPDYLYAPSCFFLYSYSKDG